MNDLGLTLAWLAIQVAFVLVPALALCTLASRRDPAAGAWIASLGLGMVVILNAAVLLPGMGRRLRVDDGQPATTVRPGDRATPVGVLDNDLRDAPRHPVGPFVGLRIAWARFERGAAEPAERCRPWGGALAVFSLAGTAIGLFRLALGLGEVVACRRRGNAVDDPEMTALLGELREAIGCRIPIELREVSAMIGPATAGWRKPAIFLPDDWRSWDLDERRAVLAHELAHIARGDYATGLLARLAVALNYFHPLVRWMAGRLRLQQELAADALGARHAGGRQGYLVALSRMALKQDERSRCWPARAFLPARGTLIRRIAMLRDETRTGKFDRPWSSAWRLAAALSLFGLTAAVATLRGPARASEDDGPAVRAVNAAVDPASPMSYLRDKLNGVVVLRPAAAFRHAGMDRLANVLDEAVGIGIMADYPEIFDGIDASRPGFLELSLKDIEWLALDLGIDKARQGGDPRGPEMHRFVCGSPAIRTVAPFDWRAYLRQWRIELAEVSEGGWCYYKLAGPASELLGPDPCAYLPDDRTLVLDREPEIRKLVFGEAAAPRPYLRGDDWARACRGLLAVAINNEEGAFTKDYGDLDRPGDEVLLSMFKGVDRWVFSVDDAEAIAMGASAVCQDDGTNQTLGRAIEPLLKLALDAIGDTGPVDPASDPRARNNRMLKALLAGVRVRQSDHSVDLRAEGFGTMADFASIVEAEVNAAEDSARNEEDAPKGPVPSAAGTASPTR